MKLKCLLLLAVSFLCCALATEAQTADPHTNQHACVDPVFRFQTNFWVNLHLFVRAESRRRSLNAPLQLPIASLSPDEQEAWRASLDAYDGMAKLSLIFDEGMVRLTNSLAGLEDTSVIPSHLIEPQIASALNGAAPVYRVHQWPEHKREDEEWIAAHCSDIQRFDGKIKQAISKALGVAAPKGPLLVDLACESGPNLAYTTAGLAGTAGHTVLAPQKNTDPVLALDTIFHEISHTMDNKIVEAIVKEADRQGVKPPEDLWHALTLYTTCEITERELASKGRPTALLDTDRANMFERNGWQSFLAALQSDWQPYLDQKVTFKHALEKLVRDTSK
jgi:hypothetical protein